MPLKKDYAMPSKIVAFLGLPKQATKHDHLDSVHPSIGWKNGILGVVVGLITYVAANLAIAWCDAHTTFVLTLMVFVLLAVLLWKWLGRISPEDLSQQRYPSDTHGW